MHTGPWASSVSIWTEHKAHDDFPEPHSAVSWPMGANELQEKVFLCVIWGAMGFGFYKRDVL